MKKISARLKFLFNKIKPPAEKIFMSLKNLFDMFVLLWVSVLLAFSASPAKLSAAAASAQGKAQKGRQFQMGKAVLQKQPEKETQMILKDPLMRKKWSLTQIQAPDTWLKYSKGSRNIIVAIIDTGIDTSHPDLKRNIWRNPKEIPNNNKDDDNNGYVDDIHGWNFVDHNNKVYDTHGHGTHIAGIIGADGGNGIGVSGVSPRVNLMALKYYNPNDSGEHNLKNTIKAIEYAVKNGAHIINYSGGGTEGNPAEKAAIQKAEAKGILFVAAAGNEGSNTDKKRKSYFPANYGLSNILPITATNTSDQVLSSSNWGKKSVHSAAPGRDILSTLPNGKYGVMTGTSQATAVASGAAVLVMDYYKIPSARFVISQLTMTGDLKNSLEGKTSRGRRLNIFRALAMRGRFVNAMDKPMAPDMMQKKFYLQGPVVHQPQEAEDQDLNIILSLSDSTKKSKRKPASLREPAPLPHKTPALKRWFF